MSDGTIFPVAWACCGLLVICLFVIFIIAVSNRATRAHAEPPQAPDNAVLTQLSHAGSDLSKPHVVDFFVYFPTREAAEMAALELGPDYVCEICEGTGQWLCLANAIFVPTLAGLISRRQLLTTIAKKYGGEYDGWGAAIVS